MTTDKDRSGQSRADALRQKRQQTSQVHLNNVHQQSSQTHVNTVRQPVSHPAAQARAATTVRRTSPYAVPVTSTSRTASARKLHYAQGANGVEVRMPAMPSLHFNWRSASLLLATGLLVIVLLLTHLDTFQISSIQLTGNKRITASQVSKIVVASKSSIFTLDSQKIIATVQSSFPEFSEIHLGLRFPNTVVLAVKERKPILAWVAKGKTQWIAADGVVMSVRGDGGTLLAIQSSVAIPTLSTTAAKTTSTDQTTAAAKKAATSATKPLKYIDPQILQAAISLSAQLPSGATLIYDPVSGIGWDDPKGWQVYFGTDLSNIAIKQTEYQAIIQRLESLGIQPKLISVAHIDSPFYRTE